VDVDGFYRLKTTLPDDLSYRFLNATGLASKLPRNIPGITAGKEYEPAE
jgi:hypothetical protein